MSAGGHIQDMLNRMRQNANRKKSNQIKFKENSQVTKGTKSEKIDYDFPEVSERRLEKIKSDIKRKANRANKNQFKIFTLLLGIAMLIMIYLYYF